MASELRSTIPARPIRYLILALVTPFGLWGIGSTLIGGHGSLATTQHVPWGLWVAAYLFFIGLSTGSFLIATLGQVLGVKRLAPLAPMALIVALLSLVLGGMLIILDLGHPERIYKVLTGPNTSSVLAWMGYLYNLYFLVLLGLLHLVLRPRLVERIRTGEGPSGLYRLLALGRLSTDPRSLAGDAQWIKRLSFLGIAIAVFLQVGEGMIFAVAKARPEWFGALLPVVFLIGGFVAGGGLLTWLVATLGPQPGGERLDLARTLARITLSVLVLDLLLIFSKALSSLYGGVPHDVEAWSMTMFGPYWFVFWIVQICVGAVIPILLITLAPTRDRLGAIGLAGLLMAIGMLGARLSIVIPGQIVPTFQQLVTAYAHPRFAYGYVPSLTEWLVLIGVLAIGFWLFAAAKRFIPIGLEPSEATSQGGK